MALSTVTLNWDLTDLMQSSLEGTLSITPTAQMSDSADHVLIPPVARTWKFTGGTGSLAGIVANDNASVLPAGTGYLISVTDENGKVIVPQFQTQLLFANGATQWLDALATVPVVTTSYQYLPLPSGTPQAGWVPVATGSGEASAWTTPAVVTLPPPTGVAATDTAAIQAAENALHAGSGGKILFQPGTYVVTGLTKYGYTTWQGAGRLTTVIQLASGSNADVVQGYQFGSLTGTGSTGGITGWAIRDLMIDGNGSHQTAASWGLRTYGYNFDVENVEISGCWSGGRYSEWGNGGANMEARERGCKYHDNGTGDATAIGFAWLGPHDSLIDTMFSWDNPGGQAVFDTHATGTHVTNSHTYGTGAFGVKFIAQSVNWSDSVAEASAGSPGMIILANGTEVIGGSIYDVNNGASTGIVIGDGTHAPNTVTVDTFVSQTNTACVNFANSGGHNTITLHAYQNSGSVVTGTPVATDAVVIKPGSYITAPGGIPQVNGSLARMLLPDPGGTAYWCQIGTWSTTAGGRLRLTITGAGGYNADVASNAQTVITCSTGSGAPTPNIQGVWFTQGGTPLIDQVKCARGANAETWVIWAHVTNGFTGNSFVQADTGSDTFLSSFTWSLTSGSDPGVASSTVAVLTEQYQVQSPAYFPNGISTGGGPVATLALTRLAATAAAGYTLVNGTGTVISWTAPNDGLLHRVIIFATIDVTVTEVGGRIAVGYTMPDGVAGYTYNLSAGSQGVGYDYSLFTPAPLIVKANTTVTISQSTALTSGAAKLWAEIWGA